MYNFRVTWCATGVPAYRLERQGYKNGEEYWDAVEYYTTKEEALQGLHWMKNRNREIQIRNDPTKWITIAN